MYRNWLFLLFGQGQNQYTAVHSKKGFETQAAEIHEGLSLPFSLILMLSCLLSFIGLLFCLKPYSRKIGRENIINYIRKLKKKKKRISKFILNFHWEK